MIYDDHQWFWHTTRRSERRVICNQHFSVIPKVFRILTSSYVLKYFLGTGLNWWLIYYQRQADAVARELAWWADKADKMTKFYINGQTLKIYTSSYLIINLPKSKPRRPGSFIQIKLNSFSISFKISCCKGSNHVKSSYQIRFEYTLSNDIKLFIDLYPIHWSSAIKIHCLH